MERRKALKVLGCIIATSVGTISYDKSQAYLAEEKDKEVFKEWEEHGLTASVFCPKQSFALYETQINEIIIERSNGKRINISFKEIIDSLENE
jgi:hypothetical protein